MVFKNIDEKQEKNMKKDKKLENYESRKIVPNRWYEHINFVKL